MVGVDASTAVATAAAAAATAAALKYPALHKPPPTAVDLENCPVCGDKVPHHTRPGSP